jgi:hypothetical protein
MALEILKKKILAKIQAQLPSIIDEAINELLDEEDISEELLVEKLQTKSTTKKTTEKKPKTQPTEKGSGYDKLPQDETELHKWIKDLFEKRKKTKLGNEKDEDKIFNVVTQRFIKRSSCQSRKGCTLVEVKVNDKEIGFTEGGVGVKLDKVPQFKDFIALFEKSDTPVKSRRQRKISETIETVVHGEATADGVATTEVALEKLILKKLSVKSLTFAELKKQIKSDQLILTLDDMTEKEIIVLDGKRYQLNKDNDEEDEDEEEVDEVDEDEETDSEPAEE